MQLRAADIMTGHVVTVAPDDTSQDVTALVFRKPRVRVEKFDWSWTTVAPSSDEGTTGAH